MCSKKMQNKYMQGDIIEENVSSRVPPEIWVRIFSLAPQSRNLSLLRLVCKQWQAIIDENFDRKVKIDDNKMDVNSIIKFRRVVGCNVSQFVGEPSRTQLFMEPGILSSLNLEGTISNLNFLLIAKQCQNVKELFLTGNLLTGDLNLFDVRSSYERNILSKFTRGLQKLVVNGLHMSLDESHPAPINLHGLLSWQMNELKNLVIQVNRVNLLVGGSPTNFFGLLEKFRSLERLDFTLRSVHAPIHNVPKPFVLQNLCTLNLEVRVPARLPVWLTFLGAQNSIKNLKWVTTHGEFYLDRTAVNAILNNANNLQSLEMRTLTQLDNRLVSQLFRGLSSLKSLTLKGTFQDNLHNLCLLPNSLEVLVLENFKCRRAEFSRLSFRGVKFTTRNVVY